MLDAQIRDSQTRRYRKIQAAISLLDESGELWPANRGGHDELDEALALLGTVLRRLDGTDDLSHLFHGGSDVTS